MLPPGLQLGLTVNTHLAGWTGVDSPDLGPARRQVVLAEGREEGVFFATLVDTLPPVRRAKHGGDRLHPVGQAR